MIKRFFKLLGKVTSFSLQIFTSDRISVLFTNYYHHVRFPVTIEFETIDSGFGYIISLNILSLSLLFTVNKLIAPSAVEAAPVVITKSTSVKKTATKVVSKNGQLNKKTLPKIPVKKIK